MAELTQAQSPRPPTDNLKVTVTGGEISQANETLDFVIAKLAGYERPTMLGGPLPSELIAKVRDFYAGKLHGIAGGPAVDQSGPKGKAE